MFPVAQFGDTFVDGRLEEAKRQRLLASRRRRRRTGWLRGRVLRDLAGGLARTASAARTRTNLR
jgi:hypothetical protein